MYICRLLKIVKKWNDRNQRELHLNNEDKFPGMKVAVIGATGMVGRKILEVLEERNFPLTELIPVASEKSIGNKVHFAGKEYLVVGIEEAINNNPDYALFSAGGAISLEFAPKFAEVGSVVIDNSSAWRMDPGKKLIIPEINGSVLTKEDEIIANPNCSTIQMLMVLAPLHKRYGIKRVVVSTYQSVTGTGVKAVKQMEDEMAGGKTEMVYPYQIHRNCIPQCDVFLENDYTKEEMKLVNESRKILADDSLAITATAVRVPVVGGHSEAVNVEFHNEFEIGEIRKLLNNTSGVEVRDNTDVGIYPMPVYAHDKDEVFVGRIRRDESQSKTLNLWIVADNIRKGAATNTVQIAEYHLRKFS